MKLKRARGARNPADPAEPLKRWNATRDDRQRPEGMTRKEWRALLPCCRKAILNGEAQPPASAAPPLGGDGLAERPCSTTEATTTAEQPPTASQEGSVK